MPVLGPQESPYEYYLQLLGKWPTAIALASQWLVTINFDSVNVLSNLQNSLKFHEQSEWTYDNGVTKILIDGGLQYRTDNQIGCVFARQVQLPGESVEASNQGLDYGGYLAPATSNTRGKYEPLTITMLETNASFLDLVIRPWTIMVGYNGLIARDKKSPKYVKSSNIDVVMYAKTGYGSPMGIRKIYRFYNCAPINLGGETYSYSEEGLRYSDVKFIYDRYAILDGNTGQFITLP
jgi:hypothetical protein